MWNPLKGLGSGAGRSGGAPRKPRHRRALRTWSRRRPSRRDQGTNANAVHHLIRYEWAARCFSDWRDEDPRPGRGFGYGVHELAPLPSATVTGIDHDAGGDKRGVEVCAAESRVPHGGCDALGRDHRPGGVRRDRELRHDPACRPSRSLWRVRASPAARRSSAAPTPCGWTNPLCSPVASPSHRVLGRDLYDFLRRYFSVVVRPKILISRTASFRSTRRRAVTYLLKMNPVICRGPIVLENPYR